MNSGFIGNYIRLVKFLGTVLGPDFEVALHDISDPDNSIIAIANGYISGRNLGGALTDHAKKILSERVYEHSDSRINYAGLVTESGNTVRSSTFFIKDQNGELQALLCINYDDSRHRDLIDQLLKLRHPDDFVEANFVYNREKARAEALPGVAAESFHGSVTSVTKEVVDKIVQDSGVPVERLTTDEKLNIISILNEKGIFLMKNAVKHVARELKCSQASVYRYVNKIHNH